MRTPADLTYNPPPFSAKANRATVCWFKPTLALAQLHGLDRRPTPPLRSKSPFPLTKSVCRSRAAPRPRRVVVVARLTQGRRPGAANARPMRAMAKASKAWPRRSNGPRRDRRRAPTAPPCRSCCRRAPRATRSIARCGISRPSSPAFRRARWRACAAGALRHRLYAFGRDAGGDGARGGQGRATGRC